MRQTLRDGRAPFVKTRVGRGAAQSLTAAVSSLIVFDTVMIDTHGMLNANKDTLVVPVTGWWNLSGSVGFATNSAGARQVVIGSTPWVAVQEWMAAVATAGDPTVASLAVLGGFFVAGTPLQLSAYQSSGGPLNTFASTSYVWLEAELMKVA